MMVSSEIFVVCFLTTLLKIDLAIAKLKPVENNSEYQYIVFVGAKIVHTADVGPTELVREVIGIGAVIGTNHILTTEEYLKWDSQPNIECFVLVGTHDFDIGGQELAIRHVQKIPQIVTLQRHTLVVIRFDRDLTTIPGVTKILFNSQFTQSGYYTDMIGIYQRDAVRLGVTTELVTANIECGQLLNVNSKDKRYSNNGSHLCLVTRNLMRVDCKSHIGTVLVYQIGGVNFLIAIKSEIHQSCSNFPYVMQFQRISPVAEWLKENVT